MEQPMSLYSSSTSSVPLVSLSVYYSKGLPLILTVDGKRRMRCYAIEEGGVRMERFWTLPMPSQVLRGEEKVRRGF